MSDFQSPTYGELEHAAAGVLSGLDVEAYLGHSSPQFRYIGEQVAAMRRQVSGDIKSLSRLDDLPVIVALRRLVARSDSILAGELSGMQCISATPGLWRLMMCEWPMGEYGQALADYINGLDLARGSIFELGAGVGHASKLLRVAADTKYFKSDLDTEILKMYNRGGIIEKYDIDSGEIPHHDLDMVFASNVLHCAKDKMLSLSSIFEMLRPGGRLVFSEGLPEVQPGRSWCLSALFGFFDGWWDRGGFLDDALWTELAERAGFAVTTVVPIRTGRLVTGRVIVGERREHQLA